MCARGEEDGYFQIVSFCVVFTDVAVDGGSLGFGDELGEDRERRLPGCGFSGGFRRFCSGTRPRTPGCWRGAWAGSMEFEFYLFELENERGLGGITIIVEDGHCVLHAPEGSNLGYSKKTYSQ